MKICFFEKRGKFNRCFVALSTNRETEKQTHHDDAECLNHRSSRFVISTLGPKTETAWQDPKSVHHDWYRYAILYHHIATSTPLAHDGIQFGQGPRSLLERNLCGSQACRLLWCSCSFYGNLYNTTCSGLSSHGSSSRNLRGRNHLLFCSRSLCTVWMESNTPTK